MIPNLLLSFLHGNSPQDDAAMNAAESESRVEHIQPGNEYGGLLSRKIQYVLPL